MKEIIYHHSLEFRGTKNWIILFLLLSNVCFSQKPPQDKNWSVVFIDDFNSTTLDPRWSVETGCKGIGFNLTTNVILNGSELTLRGKINNNVGSCDGSTPQYSFGTIHSNAVYGYGYYEIKCKFPVPGYWCAWWCYASGTDAINQPSPYCWYNEIDFVEPLTKFHSLYSTNVHSKLTKGDCTDPQVLNNNVDDYNMGGSLITDWQTYGCEWLPDKIKWFLNNDQNPTRVKTNGFSISGDYIQYPQYLVLDNWVQSGDTPTQDGDFIIDYVKSYQLIMNSSNCSTQVVNYSGDFTSFSWGVKKQINILTGSSVSSTSNVTLRASDYTILNGDFTVSLGGEFCIMPTECY